MNAIPPALATRLTALALLGVAACGPPPDYEVRRIPIDATRAEILQAGNVSRRGFRIGEGARERVVEVEDLSAGRLSVAAAPSGDAGYGGGLDIEIRETGWRSWLGLAFDARCALRWGEPGTPVEPPWQSCFFDLPGPLRSPQLVLTRRGRSDGEVFVSELRAEGRARSRRPDVFILLLDAMRFDKLRPFYADAPIGDHLEALARDAIVLNELRSSSSWTRPAVATLFTGLRADRHRVLERGDVLAESFVTVPELLHDSGYSTTSWSTNPNVLPLWGFAQGFDTFIDQGTEEWGSEKTDGGTVLSRARAALATRGGAPIFQYLHLMDPHAPYRPSEEQRKLVEEIPRISSWFPRPLAIFNAPKDWTAFLDYMGELLDTDEHVGAFVRILKDADLYDNSLVLVLADHGEEFLDHGGRDHGRTLHEEVLRIPALVKLPGNRFAGTTIDDPVSLEDLAPTLLEALGIAAPPGTDGRVIPLDGKAPLDVRPHVATLRLDGHRQTTIVDPPWKFIRNEFLGTRELYDLDADPRERNNVVIWHPDIVERLTSTLELVLGRGQEGWHVLLCGTANTSAMDIVVRTSTTPSLYGFEATEFSSSADTWRLQPTLEPRTVERAAFGRLMNVELPDQAEVLVPAGEAAMTLEIRAGSESPFDYRLGANGESKSTTLLTLDPSSAEVIARGNARVECTPADKRPADAPTHPFLRIWYVAPAEQVSETHLDPAMRERLRALGYLQ